MATDFDKAYETFLGQMEQDALVKKPEQSTFNPDAYVRSLGYTPKESDIVTGTARSLGRGVGGAIKQFGQALEYDQDQNPDIANKIGNYVSRGGQFVTNLIDKPVTEEGSHKETYFGSIESVPSSLAMNLPSMVGGALGGRFGPIGTAVGAAAGSALTYPIMQQAAAQDAYESISKLRPDIPEAQKRQMAEKSGYWEAVPEAATTTAESILFNVVPQGRTVKTLANVAKAIFKPGLKTLGKNIIKAAPFEMGGEFITGAGQANVLKEGGVAPDIDILSEGLRSAESGFYMNFFTAGLGTGINRIKGHLLEKSVTKPIPVLESGEHDPTGVTLRKQALGMLDQQLANTLDPEAYDNWKGIAEEAISNPDKGFDIYDSIKPETASKGVVDTHSEHDLLDNQSTTLYPAELIANSQYTTLYPAEVIAENRNGFVPLGEIPSGIETASPFAKINMQDEHAPVVNPEYTDTSWEDLAQRGIDIQKAQDSMLGDVIPNIHESATAIPTFVPQSTPLTPTVVQEEEPITPISDNVVPEIKGKNLAREVKQKAQQARIAKEIDKLRKAPVTIAEATEIIKEIHNKYAPNTFNTEELQPVFEGVEAYPNAILNKVDANGKTIADADILQYVKAVVSIASKSKGITPLAKKQASNRRFNVTEFTRVYSNLIASSEKKALLKSALESVAQAQQAGEVVPEEFLAAIQNKLKEQVSKKAVTKDVKETKQEVVAKVPAKKEAKPTKPKPEPKPKSKLEPKQVEAVKAVEETPVSKEVVKEEEQETISNPDEKEITKLKRELEELTKQIQEETDKDEREGLEEDARTLRKNIKRLGGSTRAKEVSKGINLNTKTKQNNEDLSNFVEGVGRTVHEVVDFIIADTSIPADIRKLAAHLKLKVNPNIVIRQNNNLGSKGKDILGEYSKLGTNRTIAYNLDLHQELNIDLYSTILHEFAHDATMHKLDSKAGQVFKTRLTQLKKELRQGLKTHNINPEDFYGLEETSGVDELLSEVFSNESFRNILDNIELTTPKGSLRSLLDKVVEIVRSILGLDIKYNTALKELITIGTKVIELDSVDGTSVTKARHAEQASKKEWAEARAEFNKSFANLKEAASDRGENIDRAKKIFFQSFSGDFRDKFPQIEKFLKNTLRMPFWIAEKMLATDPQAGVYVARIVKASENKTENYNKTFERFMTGHGDTKAFADIRDSVESLSLAEKIAFDRINVLGDMQKTEWTSIKDVPKSDYLKDLNEKVFNIYKDLRDFADKVYLQLQDEILESAVVKYEKNIAKQLKELIKASESAEQYTPAFIEGKIKSILSLQNIEDIDLVKDILDDILETQKTINKIKNTIGQSSGYMPRIRNRGQFKLTMYEQGTGEGDVEGKDKRVYMSIFPNKHKRNLERESLEKNPKDIMGAAYNPDATYIFKEEFLPKQEMSNLNVSIMASDLHLQEALDKAGEKKDLSKKEIQKIKKLVAQRSAEVLLGDSAGRHKIGRVEDYIAGFKQDPLAAFEEMINNMSLSIAKTRYIQEQMDNFNAIKKVSPEASEFAFDYIKTTITARTTADALSAKARYLTTVWFMAANLGAAMINLTQNLTMGVPELSRYTTNKDAFTKLGKYMYLVLPEGAKHQMTRGNQRTAPISKTLPLQLQEALERYRLSGLNFDTQTFLAAGANEDLSGDVLWNSFRKIGDTLLRPFKAVESANREAALLAAFDVFATKEGINLTKQIPNAKFVELYDKAVKFVDTVHFMGAGNLPINLQKSAAARTLLAMQSYGINYLNFLYNRLSSGDKAQYKAAAKSMGMLFLMGGMAGAIPAADELNKLLKMLIGRDVKLDALKTLKSVSSDEFANFLVYGAPTLVGVNISNNVNVRLPVVSALIGGQDLGVSLAGAPGAIGTKFYKMMQFASDGEFGRALGAGSPEAFARVVKAYNEYNTGFLSQTGAPVYFKGEKLKATGAQALLKAITGFKTIGSAEIAEVRFAEYELKEQWQNKRSKAINKYIMGNKEALISFNDSLKDNDQVRRLIKPINMSDILRARNKKQDKKSKQFEQENT